MTNNKPIATPAVVFAELISADARSVRPQTKAARPGENSRNGPRIGPNRIGAPTIPTTLPIRLAPAAWGMIVMPDGTIIREASEQISDPADHATPDNLEPVRNITKQAMERRIVTKRSPPSQSAE